MLRASRDGLDIARSSIDVVSQADAEDAFAELGIADRRRCTSARRSPAPRSSPPSTSGCGTHGETAVAFTCLQSVARKLAAAQVPVFLLRPTGSAIRAAPADGHAAGRATGGWRTRSWPS